MSETSSVLSLPYIQPSQAQKHVTHNEALRQLDALVQLVVQDATLTQPPASPQTGDRYVVPAGALEGWAGQDHDVAVYELSDWSFHTPQTGWVAQDLSTGGQIRFDGAQWQPVEPDLQNLDQVGVGTTADATNRLSVAAPATLLSHEGSDHQLKINKATSTDTASLLFQTGWSGRAEMGTTGSDNFAIKVSADGSLWSQALSVDGATGAVSLSDDLSVGGEILAEKLSMTSDQGQNLDANYDNTHASASTIRQFYSFNGVLRCGLVANNALNKFFLAMYNDAAEYKGLPLTIEFAETESMTNALYIDKDRNVGIGKKPDTNLDVDGPMRLAPMTKAALPLATDIGAGGMAFVTDAAGGAQPAYSDGLVWLKIRDGLPV